MLFGNLIMHSLRVDEISIPIGGVLWVTSVVVFPINESHAKSIRVTKAPLEVVQYAPGEVASDINTPFPAHLLLDHFYQRHPYTCLSQFHRL